MSKLVKSILSFTVAATALPIGKVGLAVSLAGYFFGLIFATRYARSLPDDRHRALASFVTALLLVGIPCIGMFLAGPRSGPGDGGPDFLYLFILIGAAILAAPFLIWSLVCIWPD